MRLFQILAVSAAMLALPLTGCKKMPEDGLSEDVLRYRVTVEVSTPEGMRSGSSVYELEYYDNKTVLPIESRPSVRVTGEAVAIDLPNEKTLFLLMKDRKVTPAYAFPDIWNDEKYKDGRVVPLRRIKPKAEIWPSLPEETQRRYDDAKRRLPNQKLIKLPLQPFLVNFEDTGDPTSVKEVNPDDLAASFGEGYALKRITVEITNDPVTTGIQKRLGWLSTYPEPRLDPDYKGSTQPNLSQSLSHGDFHEGNIE